MSKSLKRICPRLESSEITVFHWILSKYKISTGFVTSPNVIFHVPFKAVCLDLSEDVLFKYV